MQLTYPEISKVYRHLRDVKEGFGPRPDRHARVIVMIAACIEKGFDERYQIIKALRALGLSRDHVVRLLDANTGTVRGIHTWRYDDGRYQLLDDA